MAQAEWRKGAARTQRKVHTAQERIIDIDVSAGRARSQRKRGVAQNSALRKRQRPLLDLRRCCPIDAASSSSSFLAEEDVVAREPFADKCRFKSPPVVSQPPPLSGLCLVLPPASPSARWEGHKDSEQIGDRDGVLVSALVLAIAAILIPQMYRRLPPKCCFKPASTAYHGVLKYLLHVRPHASPSCSLRVLGESTVHREQIGGGDGGGEGSGDDVVRRNGRYWKDFGRCTDSLDFSA
ncbi:hypothetical protein K438DRAFT_1943851 [Mycena galopus ATCC 62051]|nr:hypothetical protein K438DRAFT_1943851 [Mycena galopus ATCC 62051]